MMQASKKIPFEDERVLMGVRALYIVSNVLIFAVSYYITMQINKKKGTCPSSHLPSPPFSLFLPSPPSPRASTPLTPRAPQT